MTDEEFLVSCQTGERIKLERPRDHDPLEVPEDYLWVECADDTLRVIRPRRLSELAEGAVPRDPVEAMLAANPDWLQVYLVSFVGMYPIHIPEGGPLPDIGDPEGVLLTDADWEEIEAAMAAEEAGDAEYAPPEERGFGAA
jgi:hypothetical protein